MALNINEQARKEANLRLLQRTMDPTISNIQCSATHVVLYEFRQDLQSWEKSDVEGSMFLAVRASGYLLVILNRNSRDNYPMELTPNFQLQHSDPYLIFRQQQNNDTIIRGIWFPNPSERIAMNDKLQEALEEIKHPKPTTSVDVPTHTATTIAAASGSAATSTARTTSSSSSSSTNNNNNNKMDQSALLAALLSPVSLGNPSTSQSIRQESPSQQQAQQQPTLDKKSLQLALLSLIQDDRFLDLIHAQYLKVAHARANRNPGSN